MKSMTGYVRLEKTVQNVPVSFELKSYNGRYVDIKINLPPFLFGLEPFVREYFSAKIVRGNVEISLRCASAPSSDFTVDAQAAKKYNTALLKLAQALGCSYSPDVQHLASLPGVLVSAAACSLDAWKAELLPVFDEAFQSFDEAKKREGAHCTENITKHLAAIDAAVSVIERERGTAEAEFEKGLRKKFLELVGSSYDEMRVLQEVAVLVNKYTIEEELVRLRAHFSAMEPNMAKEGAVAKRLDFISQEMNREINTVASKSTSYKIAEQVVIVKEAIENIREQLKNLE